jgi:hypothetical protein
MIKNTFPDLRTIVAVLSIILITACTSPVKMTTWSSPKEHAPVTRVGVWGMFNKPEYQKTFESCVASYFNNHGLKSIELNSVITAGQKYQDTELDKIYDNVHTDGILIVTYEGTDTKDKYIAQTVYPQTYDYYAWGYPMYGYGSSYVTTGGYWAETSIVNLRANLYLRSDKSLIWSAEISVTDPKQIDEISYRIASYTLADWQQKKLVVK